MLNEGSCQTFRKQLPPLKSTPYLSPDSSAEPGKVPGTDSVDQLNHISLSEELKLRVAVFLRVPDLLGGL
ncbi:hypothetical protein J1605_011897 [Eschrichtius robustus]|uniref:Uncharacterized protein n=1 Tax=Eschrichtius robustus TaxID=9764 RepID=A0AB34GLJ0_ESCRO|nr:hypothetical protein J1605_011897 [Eschrichtius robustus]